MTDNDVKEAKAYICEGCGATFPTSIEKATHGRHSEDNVTWKAEQGEPTSHEREDVEREDESIY